MPSRLPPTFDLKACALDLEDIIVKWRHALYGMSEDQIQFSQQMQVTNGNFALPTTGRRLIKIAALKSTKSRFCTLHPSNSRTPLSREVLDNVTQQE
jgi:hypothetical protein